LLAGLGVAGSWVLCVYQEAGTAFIQTILWEQSATRIVHSVAHARPWWAYLLIFPVLLFPWPLWPTAWRGLRARGEPRAERLAAASIVPAFVAFSLISGKQPHYLLPLVPMAALWLAPRVARAELVSSGAAPGFALIVVGAAIAVAAPWFDLAQVGIATGAALAAGGVLFLRAGADRYAVIRRMAFANAIAIALLTVAFFSTMGETYQLDRSAAVVRELEDRGVAIAWIGHYDGQFNFLARLDQPLAVFDPRATVQIDEWVAAHPEGRLMTYSRGARESDLGPEFHQQRYRSGWLAVIPASEAHLAARMALRGGSDQDSVSN
jgi:4-amino-4-deoxy-L-arabinose transferase-like glycosyltransferase